MEHITDNSKDACTEFVDKLDLWLAGELDRGHSFAMQAHHDACVACRQETGLARQIDAITQALPVEVYPEIPLLVSRTTGNSRVELGSRATQQADVVGNTFITRLVAIWRQPLVFIPAFALVLVTLLVFQFHGTGTPIDPQIVIIDGQEYTREDIIRAAADLEIALRYLDKYGSYPARVVRAELEQSRLPLPPPGESSNTPAPAI